VTRANAIPLAGSTLILVAAMLIGPHSCEAGAGNGYLAVGAVAMLGCLIAPFLGRGAPAKGRGGVALRGSLICGGVWILGLVLGGFRIMCRLF
jgi:hypothetical protein